MIYLILVLLGLCMGSFVNALVWRLYIRDHPKSKKFSKTKREVSVLRGRSMCAHCGHQLSIKDLIPVLSWLLLRGRCRYCQKSIADTPLPEVLTPLLFVLSYYFWPYGFTGLGIMLFACWLVIIVVLVALFLYDLRWMILPDKLTRILLGLSIVIVLLRVFEEGVGEALLALLGLVSVGGLFFLLYQVSQGKWIGGGDVKLGYSIGLLVGSPLAGFMTVFIASILGTLAAAPQLMRRKKQLTSKLPFGPFLIVATIIVFLFGESFYEWYLSVFIVL